MIADDSRFNENQALPYKNSPYVIQLKLHWPMFRMTQLIWRDYILRVVSCELQVVSCELVFIHILRVASCELRIANCELVFHHINSFYAFVLILDSSQSFL